MTYSAFWDRNSIAMCKRLGAPATYDSGDEIFVILKSESEPVISDFESQTWMNSLTIKTAVSWLPVGAPVKGKIYLLDGVNYEVIKETERTLYLSTSLVKVV